MTGWKVAVVAGWVFVLGLGLGTCWGRRGHEEFERERWACPDTTHYWMECKCIQIPGGEKP